MTSSFFLRLLKDATSSEAKRSEFIKKLRSSKSKTRSILVTKLRLAFEHEDVKECFNKDCFGDVEKITFHHTKKNDYTKCAIVKMNSFDAVEKILAYEAHEILGHRVCVEPHSGSTQIKKPPFVKGRYKLKLTQLKKGMSDVKLNELIEDVFAKLGHHTSIEIWKDDKGKLLGEAEIRFVHKEDGLEALRMVTETQMPEAKLMVPKEDA